MVEKNAEYDYDSKNEKLDEVEVDVDSCINNIIIKPVVNISADIEGLEASMFVTETSEEKEDENLECDNESVNHIVIKPVVKVDITISGLNTTVAM